MDLNAPLTRHPLIDATQWWLIGTHDIVVPFILVLLVVQWIRPKGTRWHVLRGRSVTLFFVVIAVASGFAILMTYGSNGVIPKHIGRTFFPAFGLSAIVFMANALLPVRYMKRLWPLQALHALTLVSVVYSYQTLVDELFTGSPESYNWQICFELAVMESFVPLFTGVNVMVLARVSRGADFRWADHHKLNMVFLAAVCASGPLLPLAHDSYWVFTSGGLVISRHAGFPIGSSTDFFGCFRSVRLQVPRWISPIASSAILLIRRQDPGKVDKTSGRLARAPQVVDNQAVSSVWGRSSVGRASRSQCEGREFDSPRLHQFPFSSQYVTNG